VGSREMWLLLSACFLAEDLCLEPPLVFLTILVCVCLCLCVSLLVFIESNIKESILLGG
jgi:hypothetical protein